MKALTLSRSCRVTAACLAAWMLLPLVGGAMPWGGPSRKEEKQLVAIRRAGVRGDRAQVPAIVNALQHPTYPGFVVDSLMALSRLGATEALPAIDGFINKTGYTDRPQDAVFARAARARLVALDAARSLNDPNARAAAEVRRFYQELALTPDALNAALANPNHRDNFGIDFYALEFLTDMVYRDGPYKAFAALPEVSRVNFDVYPGSGFEMRMAPLTHRQRIDVMTRDLSQGHPVEGVYFAEMSCLADEGPDAVATMTTQVKKLEAQAASSQGRPNRADLDRLIKATGDPDKDDVEMITTY